MNKLPKCEYCKKPLSMNNTVLIRIDRFDKYGFQYKQYMCCTNCWDLTTIFVKGRSNYKYYNMNQLPTDECIVEFKDNPHKCGNCRYLIFKRYDESRGYCRLLRIHRNFEDICVHEEE